jgi:hypothetical protein
MSIKFVEIKAIGTKMTLPQGVSKNLKNLFVKIQKSYSLYICHETSSC